MANPETEAQHKILLALSGSAVLFRNNVGALKADDGRFVRFGVGGPGGSDLIGWRTVGGVAVFSAIEVKGRDGRLSPQQAHFLDAVRMAGGFAGMARDEAEAKRIIGLA